MAMITLLDTTTGRLQSLSRGQLDSILKQHRREAARVLKLSRAAHVLYALQHDSTSYHIVPYKTYSDARYKACFGGKSKIKPLAVHHK